MSRPFICDECGASKTTIKLPPGWRSWLAPCAEMLMHACSDCRPSLRPALAQVRAKPKKADEPGGLF